MDNTLNQRITDVVSYLIFSKVALDKRDLSQKLGYNVSSFSQIINGRVPVSDKFIERLLEFAPDLNENWLLTGEGEMLKVPATLTVYKPTNEERQDLGASSIDMSVVPAEMVEEIRAEIRKEATITQPPYVPINIARKPNLDVMEWLESGNGRHASSTFNIMSIVRDTTFYTKVRSNAMSPALNQGEILFLKEFDKGFQFVDGQPYVIDTRSRGMLAYYLFDRGEYIEARPHNARFETLNIPKDDVIRYYIILFHGSTWVSTSLPTGNCQAQVEKQSEQISSLIHQLGKAGDRADKMGEQVTRVLDMMEKKL